MASRTDIDSLLRTGYFTTTRSRSPRPPSPPYERSYGRRASPRPDVFVPRSMAARPPPPSCEDESESLLKEHGSVVDSTAEEPPSRGDVDQATLMEEVHEHNPERRFVFVPTTDSPAKAPRPEREREARPERKPPVKEAAKETAREPTRERTGDTPPPVPPKGKASKEYEANTARRYDTTNLTAEPAAPEKRRPSTERRKSRQDLPQIETEFNIEPTKGHHRTRSSTYADQPRPDYFAGHNKRMSTNEDHLSPQVIKHTTGGRDKIYYDYSKPQPTRPLAPQRSRTNLASDRRTDDSYGRPTQSLSPGATRRGAAETETPRSSKPAYGDAPSDSSRYRQEPERRRERRNSYRRESPPPRDGRADSNSSGEGGASLKPAPPISSSRRRLSAVIHDDRPTLPTPDREKAAASSRRSRSRAPTSPLPSPRISNGGSFMGGPPSPRASGTFPLPRDSREALPYPDDEPPKYESLPIRDDRYAPRSRTTMPSAAMAMPAVMPVMPVMPSESDGPFNRTIVATPIQDPRMSSSQPNLDSAWPPVFDPAKDGLKVDDSNSVSFRRYSEDVGRGGLPEIPDCPRRKGAAGKTDWLALPRCDNFNICPTCYTAVFAESPFRNEFVPMPFRPADKLIVCDFGTSPWYRIAWLLTIKNGQPDLRLFHQIAQINNIANSQPCPKDRESVRVWYSIRDPRKQSTLADYTVCYECCKTIEILLPNLTGVFVPLQTTAVPSLSRCSMHFHATRKRFVLYFDALETASDEALATKTAPDIARLARVIGRLSIFTECHQDRPVRDQNWHIMQYLPEFSVCGECFDDVVKPELEEGSIASDFYAKPQRLQVATCQLYSKRMRDVFVKACRRNDAKYLESRVLERLNVERDIQARLAQLHRYTQDERTERDMDKLIDEWRKWE